MIENKAIHKIIYIPWLLRIRKFKKESNINLKDAKFFAGHSLGEYSALAASGSLDFKDAVKLLNQRGKAMQSAVPKGTGGMVAVLGVEINEINNLLKENQNESLKKDYKHKFELD